MKEKPDLTNILGDDLPKVDSHDDWKRLTPEQKELFKKTWEGLPDVKNSKEFDALPLEEKAKFNAFEKTVDPDDFTERMEEASYKACDKRKQQENSNE